MNENLESFEQLEQFRRSNVVAAVYFSGPDCAVCSALKPKVYERLGEAFPRLALAEVDCGSAVELASQLSVFTIPTLIVYFDGREFMRKVRNFSPAELVAELERPYGMCFDE